MVGDQLVKNQSVETQCVKNQSVETQCVDAQSAYFNASKKICQKTKTQGIWSNAFDNMINFKTYDRMNKYKVIDISIVYADKLQLVK